MKKIKDVSKLYKTGLQKDIKLAFDFFEKLCWNSNDIIKYIIHFHRTETTDSRIKAIDNRKFSIGPLHFIYNVIEDWEAPDITTYYFLELSISLKDINDEIVKSAIIKEIQSETTEDPFWGMSEDDYLSFTEKMFECTNKIFENIDTSKTENLYDYLYHYFYDYIDKINNKEIILY